ncbi:MAG: RNA-binding domain-containing protein [Candidatus Thorarchaeota archaeon]|jgi:RNA binding exosome subunit
MLSITRLEARAFSRATEVLDRVKTAILNLFPPNLRENIELELDRTTSYCDAPIIILTATTNDEDVGEKTLHHILNQLPTDDKKELAYSLNQRINEKCDLFLRIDKQDVFLGNIRLAKKPDLVHVEVRFTMYPRCNRDTVIAHIMKQLNGNQE